MSLTEFCLEQSKVTDMKIADNASIDDNTHGGGEIPPCAGLTPNALPEVQEPVLAENSQTGVSLDFVPKETTNVLYAVSCMDTQKMWLMPSRCQIYCAISRSVIRK